MRCRTCVVPILGLLLAPRVATAQGDAPGGVSLSPQIVIPFGAGTDMVGPGGGISVRLRRAVHGEVQATASAGYLGFHGANEAQLVSLDLLAPGVPVDGSSRSRYDTQGMSLGAGVWLRLADAYFLSLEVGDLYTRSEVTTEIDADGATRTVGSTVVDDHGPVFTLAAGLDSRHRPAGLKLSYSPTGRGSDGDKHLAWLSIFVGL